MKHVSVAPDIWLVMSFSLFKGQFASVCLFAPETDTIVTSIPFNTLKSNWRFEGLGIQLKGLSFAVRYQKWTRSPSQREAHSKLACPRGRKVSNCTTKKKRMNLCLYIFIYIVHI